uniref:BTB domain-containing protein n=1 Tax=Panagrolaimus sp. ES5 TaxID=591445 RepID=A0AC34FET2_9BILA
MECAIATDWIVEEKALHEVVEDGCLESQHIQTTIPSVKYCIQIHPNGKSEDGNEVYFQLKVITTTLITADVTFSIPSAKFSENFNYGYDNDDDIYGPYVLKREAFFQSKNKYFQNGKLNLQLRGTLSIEQSEQQSLGIILWKRDDKDFIIQVDNKEIKAHKYVLRALSPVFAAMFDSGMKEAQENKAKIEGFSFDVVYVAVKFCYDIKWFYYFNDELLSLLKFSDIYDIAHLKAYIEQNLVKSFSPNNVCSIANAAVETNANKLRSYCLNYLIKCSKDSTPIAKMDSLDDALKYEFALNAVSHKI